MSEEATYEIGQKLAFIGYSEQPEDPYFTPGEIVQVAKLADDNSGGIMACGLDALGKPRADGVLELLFPEEVNAEYETQEAEAPAEAEVAAPVEAPKNSGKKGGKKSSAKTEATAPVTPVAAVSIDSGATIQAASGAEDFGPRSNLVRAAMESVAAGADENQAALLAAQELINRVEKTYYTLGGVLSYIKERGAYKARGYDGKRGFAEYCAKELDTDYRKAQYLIDIYETVQLAGLNEDRMSEIGWSKAKEIIRIGRDVSMEKLNEDFDGLIEFANSHNRTDLINHIKTSYEGITTRQGSGEKVQVSAFSFRLTADQAATAERALSAAKRVAGTESMDEAFAFVLNDWLMMNEGSEITLDTAISVLEHRFDVTLRTVSASEDEALAEGSDEATVAV